MKRGSTIFLQVVIALLGVGVLALLLWEPQVEGRNVNATLFEIYFKDPFLAYIYLAFVPFFVGLTRAFKPLRAEYDKADEKRKAALWKANERNFEDAREREEQRLREYQEKTEKTFDLMHRLQEDPSKTHLLPPDDASTD